MTISIQDIEGLNDTLESFIEALEMPGLDTDSEVDKHLATCVEISDNNDGSYRLTLNLGNDYEFPRQGPGVEFAEYQSDEIWIGVYRLENPKLKGIILYTTSAGEYRDDNYDAQFLDDMVLVPDMQHPCAKTFIANEARSVLNGLSGSLHAAKGLLETIGVNLDAEKLLKQVEAEIDSAIKS